jgi:hypothetical protein
MTKPLLRFLYIFLLAFYIGCTNENQKRSDERQQTQIEKPKQQTSTGFSKTLEGNIAGKYPVSMQLSRKGSQLEGTYMYTKVGTPIPFSGTIDENGNISMQEFDEKGKTTGFFEGVLTADFNFTGNWRKSNSNKSLTFSLHEQGNSAGIENTQAVSIIERSISLERSK